MISLKNSALAVFATVGLLVQTGVFAACAIDTGPNKDLSDYIKNLDRAITEISSRASGANCGNTSKGTPSGTDGVSRAVSVIVGSTNKAFSPEDMASSGRFSIDLILRSEIPDALRRDYNLLLRKQAAVNSLIDGIYRNCGGDIRVLPADIIDDPGFSGENGEEKALGDIAGDLLTNHVKIIGFYRESVIGIPPSKSGFFLVGPDFSKSVQTDYGPKGTEACNKKWVTWERAVSAIKRISDQWSLIEASSNDWKEAMKLLQSDGKDQAKLERQLLSAKLAQDGLSTKNSKAILRNLEHYNKTEEWRGISGFLADTGDRVAQGFAEFKKVYDGISSGLEESKTTDEWVQRYENIQAMETDIGKEILLDYQSLVDRIGDENLSTDQINGKLTGILAEIDTATKTLEPYRELAQKACKGQTQNESGNCTGK